jgi:hypothetical protein
LNFLIADSVVVDRFVPKLMSSEKILTVIQRVFEWIGKQEAFPNLQAAKKIRARS